MATHAFRERHHKPLGHLSSIVYYTTWRRSSLLCSFLLAIANTPWLPGGAKANSGETIRLGSEQAMQPVRQCCFARNQGKGSTIFQDCLCYSHMRTLLPSLETKFESTFYSQMILLSRGKDGSPCHDKLGYFRYDDYRRPSQYYYSPIFQAHSVSVERTL